LDLFQPSFFNNDVTASPKVVITGNATNVTINVTQGGLPVGDASGDGKVDIVDVLFIAQATVGLRIL